MGVELDSFVPRYFVSILHFIRDYFDEKDFFFTNNIISSWLLIR